MNGKETVDPFLNSKFLISKFFISKFKKLFFNPTSLKYHELKWQDTQNAKNFIMTSTAHNLYIHVWV